MDAWTLAFSPDSRFLATGSHSGKINIFGVDSGRKEMTMDTRGKFTLSIAYVSTLYIKGTFSHRLKLFAWYFLRGFVGRILRALHHDLLKNSSLEFSQQICCSFYLFRDMRGP